MVAPLQSNYSNRKGIYKDLYREIDADNKKKEASKARSPRKGIYRDIYKHIEKENALIFKANQKKQDKDNFWHRYISRMLFFTNNLLKILKPKIGSIA